MRRALLVGLCTALAVASLSACGGDDSTASNTTTTKSKTTSSTKPGTTTSTVWPMNEKLRNTLFGIEVFSVDDPYQPEGKDVAPSAGNRYVAVDMEVTNLSTKTVTVLSGLQFVLEASNGTKFQPKGGGHGKGPIDGQLKSDGSRRRAVVYEVPNDASRFTLLFTGRFGGPVTRIALN
jgi:hypothetical protein